MGQLKQIGGRWAGHGAAGPRAHFLNGEVGQLLDFSDMRQLYQDNTGATALTLPNQTAGLASDRSRARSPVTSYAAVQANASWRPKWGRAPVSVRNAALDTENFASTFWAKSVVTVASAVGSGPLAGMVADRIIGAGYLQRVNSFGAIPITQSIYVKADGGSLLSLVVGDVGEGSFDLLTQVATGSVQFEALADGWFRVWATHTPLTGARIYRFTVDGGMLFSGAQLERAGAVSAYQRVGATVFDVTEAGVPSYGYIRPDLSDDKLTTTFPTALTGDLMIHGRNGSWIEPISITAGGTFDLGPTGTLATPGILRAVGDIVGCEIIGRTLTDAERTAAIAYWRARGALGRLVAGAEMIVNGDISGGTTGWTLVHGAMSAVSGRLRVARSGGGLGRAVSTAMTCIVGQPYLVTLESYKGTVTTADWGVYISATSSVGLIYGASSTLDGVKSFVFTATQTTHWLSLQCSVVGVDGDYTEFDNISLKPLVAT